MYTDLRDDPAAYEETAGKPDFWCVVALDYDKDRAWILDRSADCRTCDLAEEPDLFDNGGNHEWVKHSYPGLYKVTLKPWSRQNYFGDWDAGIDVVKAELLCLFPGLKDYGV